MKNETCNKENLLDNDFKICCFTGHRNFAHSKKIIKKQLKKLILKAIQEQGYNYFISGGATGFDTLAAECVIEVRKQYSDIMLEIAIPHPKQSQYFTAKNSRKYSRVLKKADYKTVLFPTYTNYCYHARNKYMVNKSSLIIAYFNNLPSGTKHAITYAQQQNKTIWFIENY